MHVVLLVVAAWILARVVVIAFVTTLDMLGLIYSVQAEERREVERARRARRG